MLLRCLLCCSLVCLLLPQAVASEQSVLDELLLPDHEHRAEFLFGGRLQLGDEFDGMKGQTSVGLHLQFGLHDWPYEQSPWAITLDTLYSTSEGGDFFGPSAQIDTIENYLGISYGWDQGRHHWSVNPGLGLAILLLRDSLPRIEDGRGLQLAGHLALRYRYQFGSNFTAGVHASSQASRMVTFGNKKVQILALGLHLSLGGQF